MATATFGDDGKFLGCTIGGIFHKRLANERVLDFMSRVSFHLIVDLPRSNESFEEQQAIE